MGKEIYQTKDSAKFHIILVQALTFKNKQVLIAQRGYEELQAPGLWSLPGGKVELYGNDENVIEKTLKDEFREEVGIELNAKINYFKSYSFVRIDGSSVISLCFLAKWKSGDAQPLEDSIAVAWITKDQLDDFDFAPKVKNLIELGFFEYEKI